MNVTEAQGMASPPADRLESLYLEHAAAALRFAYLITGSREQAEDTVHDAFLRAFARYASLRREDAFAAYLRQTILNVVRGARRRERREAAKRHRLVGSNIADPSADVAERRAVLAALTALPVRQRAAIVLRYYEDMSEAQVADVLRCSVASVKSLTARGAEAFRKQFGGTRDGT